MLLDTPPRPATAAWPRAEASDSAVEDEEEGLDVDGEGSNEEGSLDEETSSTAPLPALPTPSASAPSAPPDLSEL